MFIFCKGNNYLSLRNFIYSILVNSLFLLATKKSAIFFGYCAFVNTYCFT